MGAHNAATLDVARQRAEKVRDDLRARESDHVAEWWADQIELGLERGRTTGTLKAWMQAHDGEPVDTLQVTIVVARDGHSVIEPERPWAPGSRRIDATRAAVVLLNDSRRDYAGVTTFLTEEKIYVGFAKWGADRVQMLVYVA